jgi:sensor histidine kinase regulating citrate/malate metabolism
MKSYQKNIPIYESLISDIRSSQHEYSNRLQALSTLPFTCTDYDSLCTALIKYTKEYSHSLHGYSLLQTNMPLLSASLYNLMNKAAKNDITVHFDVVSSTLKSSVPEYILSDMACILLQNAVEECKENDFIYVFMESTDGTMKFEVRNPSAVYYAHGELLNFFNKGVSTKSPETNHGIGLYYLKKMIDKYNGTIGADCVCYNNEIWTVFKFQV